MSLVIRLMRHEDAQTTQDVIMQAFQRYNAPDFAPEGVQGFTNYASAAAMQNRQHNDHIILIAEQDEKIVGVIESRHHNHISLMFVHPDHMNKGISTALWQKALALCKQAHPGLETITVNASTYAAPIYEKFGFTRDAEGTKTEHGIIVVPMTYTFEADEMSKMHAEFLHALRASDGEPLTPLLFEFRNLLSPIISAANFLHDTGKNAVDDPDQALAPDTVHDISHIVLDYATRLQSMLDALQTYSDDISDPPKIPKPNDTPPKSNSSDD